MKEQKLKFIYVLGLYLIAFGSFAEELSSKVITGSSIEYFCESSNNRPNSFECSQELNGKLIINIPTSEEYMEDVRSGRVGYEGNKASYISESESSIFVLGEIAKDLYNSLSSIKKTGDEYSPKRINRIDSMFRCSHYTESKTYECEFEGARIN